MDLRKTLKYAGLCASVAFAAFGASSAMAAGPFSDDGVITFTMTEPSATPTTSDVNLGTAGVISKAGSVAKLVIKAKDGTVDETNAGTAPNTRLFKMSYATADVLTFAVAGGAALEQMSFKIGHADANNAGGVDTVSVTLSDGNANDGTFIVDTWDCGIPDGGTAYKGAVAGTNTAETLTGFASGSGTGTLKLGDTAAPAINNGVAKVACGFTVKTDNLGKPYPTGPYTGNVRVAVDYL